MLAVKLSWTRAPSGHAATRPLTQLSTAMQGALCACPSGAAQLVSPPDWGTATVRSLLEAVLTLQGLGTDLCHPRTPAGPAIMPSLILGSLGELLAKGSQDRPALSQTHYVALDKSLSPLLSLTSHLQNEGFT